MTIRKCAQLFFSLLVAFQIVMEVRSSSSATERGVVSRPDASALTLRVVFSDVDGTLIHYDRGDEKVCKNYEKDASVVKLPPSSTGMRGFLSVQTLHLCKKLRSQQDGICLVLISGMRTSTMMDRIPFLPKADVYCCESGGRIFYPVDPSADSGRVFYPEAYPGATGDDLKPFCLIEDKDWREEMERLSAAGRQGFLGNEIDGGDDFVPLPNRDGRLWRFATYLQQNGVQVDSKSYSTCFRVNKKHQSSDDLFSKLLTDDMHQKYGLARSTNLGCIDFFPATSGKLNCCQHIASKLEISLETQACCICDDDNDIEMALACQAAFLPSVSAEEMLRTVEENSSKLRVFANNKDPIRATDAALKELCKTYFGV